MRYFSYLHKSWHAGVVTLLGMMLYSRQGLSNTHTLASILFEKRGWGLSHIFPAQRGKQTFFFLIHSKRACLWPGWTEAANLPRISFMSLTISHFYRILMDILWILKDPNTDSA